MTVLLLLLLISPFGPRGLWAASQGRETQSSITTHCLRNQRGWDLSSKRGGVCVGVCVGMCTQVYQGLEIGLEGAGAGDAEAIKHRLDLLALNRLVHHCIHARRLTLIKHNQNPITLSGHDDDDDTPFIVVAII